MHVNTVEVLGPEYKSFNQELLITDWKLNNIHAGRFINDWMQQIKQNWTNEENTQCCQLKWKDRALFLEWNFPLNQFDLSFNHLQNKNGKKKSIPFST